MNRKSKIIVSVVGIAIVLLALLGITYAYYLTKIEGNTNTNSISVTTADLKLVYGDGNGLVTASDIMPGTTITKTFTVANSGKSKVEGYLVVLEGVTNELARKEDLVYTLTCKLQDETSCGTITETVYPSIPTSVIFTNDIDVDVTQYYTLTVTYKNLEDVDQSEDMGKTFSGRVNIMDANTNPYTTGVTETDNASLAYNIINNSMSSLNGTTFSASPLTTPASEISGYKYVGSNPTSYTTNTPTANYYFVYSDTYEINSNGYYVLSNPTVFKYTTDLTSLKGKYITSYSGYNTESTANTNATVGKTFSNIYYVGDATTETILSRGTVVKTQVSTEKILSTTNDVHGTSYYYRGGVQDNYVLFNNMCFRIVRIEGDGSVKIIYAGDVSEGATNCNEVGTDTGVLKDSDDNTIYPVYGYDNTNSDGYYYADYENNVGGKAESSTGLKEELETWYTSKFNTDTLTGKLKTDKWCLGGNENYKYDDSGNLFTETTLEEYYDKNGYYYYNYVAGNRVWTTKTTSLMCENEDYVSSKYGTITSDEVMLAGGTTSSNTTYYLRENVQSDYYWTLSRAYFGSSDVAFDVYDGVLSSSGVYSGRDAVRPAVTLVTGTTISSGDGRIDNPYIIN